MKAYLLLLLVTLIPVFSPAQTKFAQGSTSVSPSGFNQTASLQVKLRLAETLSSANAKLGQTVWLNVVDPVEVNGKVIIASGARARGSVTRVKRRGRNRREGQLQFTVLALSETDGSEVHVQSAAVQKGSGQGEPIFGPCTFPFPADPTGLFRKGEDVVIPKGTELIAEIVGKHR